jgi:hypothetical protein
MAEKWLFCVPKPRLKINVAQFGVIAAFEIGFDF